MKIPATFEASGFWLAISNTLPSEYLWKRAMVVRY